MHAINAGVMRQNNRCMVLDCIRRRPVSRSELSSETCLTRASITQIVESLIAEGLVRESTPVDNHRPGRRQTLLTLASDARCIAGINISRRGYDLGLIDLAGQELWVGTGLLCDRAPDAVLDEIARRLAEAAASRGLQPGQIYGAGVSAPGPLDAEEGVLLNPPNFRAWHGVPVASVLQERLGWRTFLANVANAHALDELYFGVGRAGVRDFMLLRVDEGVGGGIVLDGRLFSGARGRCPEIGHITVNRSGPPCNCGNRGCLEQYISFPAALEGTPFSSWNEVMDALDTSPEAAALFDRMTRDLGFEVVNIINVFDLEKIVLSGHLAYGGARLAEAVSRWVDGLSLRRLSGQAVVSSGLPHPVRIAAMPAYHSFFNPSEGCVGGGDRCQNCRIARPSP